MRWSAVALLGLGLIACVICSSCSSSPNYSNGQILINTSSLPSGTVGTAYSYSIPASGGTPPYTFSLGSGTLPAGLQLSTRGVISGTPVAAGTTNFTVDVTDSQAVPASASANLSLAVMTELTVTSISVPAGTLGISYNAALSASGGVAPYTWALTSGSLPVGLSLSTAGVIEGTPTASGTSSFTVQVTDSETSAQTASAQLNLTINVLGVTTPSLSAGTINVPYFAALSAIGGRQPYTWTASGSLPAGLSMSSAGVISGTPTVTGTSRFTAQVADSEHPPATASAQLSITIGTSGSGASTLAGNYVFYLNGFNAAGPWTLAGSFVADGQGNVSGIVDANSVAGQPMTATVTGSYPVVSSAMNTITIQGQSWGPMTLAYVLDSTGSGRMIEYDDTTGQGSRGSGPLRKATSSAFALDVLNGAWATGITGADATAQRVVGVGQFQMATGTLSNGSLNTNDAGDVESATFTGTLSVVNPQTGRATLTFNTSNGTTDAVVYVVSSSELVMEFIDPVSQPLSWRSPASSEDNTGALLVGSVFQQSGSLSNASLDGTAVLHLQDVEQPEGLDDAIAAIVSFDGNGNFVIPTMDEDLAGSITQEPSAQGSYSVGNNGAISINCVNGDCLSGFLFDQNQAFVAGSTSSASFGMIEAQNGGPFSNSSIAGTEAGGSLPPLDSTARNEVDAGMADGSGTLTLSEDASNSNGIFPSSDVLTYNMAANGRGTAQSGNNQSPSVVYMISPTKWIALQPNADAELQLFQH